MTDITAELNEIEGRAHQAWAQLRDLQRRVSDADRFYAVPVEDHTAGDTLTHHAIADAVQTIHRFTDELERIRLTLLIVEHGPHALAARSAVVPF